MDVGVGLLAKVGVKTDFGSYWNGFGGRWGAGWWGGGEVGMGRQDRRDTFILLPLVRLHLQIIEVVLISILWMSTNLQSHTNICPRMHIIRTRTQARTHAHTHTHTHTHTHMHT